MIEFLLRRQEKTALFIYSVTGGTSVVLAEVATFMEATFIFFILPPLVLASAWTAIWILSALMLVALMLRKTRAHDLSG